MLKNLCWSTIKFIYTKEQWCILLNILVETERISSLGDQCPGLISTQRQCSDWIDTLTGTGRLSYYKWLKLDR